MKEIPTVHLFNDDTRKHRQNLIAARQHLNDVCRRDGHEYDDFLDANDAVIAAEKPLKWWQRLDIDTDLHTRDRDDTDEF